MNNMTRNHDQILVGFCVPVDQPAWYWGGDVNGELCRPSLSALSPSPDSLSLSSGVPQVHAAPSYRANTAFTNIIAIQIPNFHLINVHDRYLTGIAVKKNEKSCTINFEKIILY